MPPVQETAPTPEEFEEARRRELARLDLRISSIMGRTTHTQEDPQLLEEYAADQRWSDMEIVRRWVASSAGRDTGTHKRTTSEEDRGSG